MFLSRTTPCLPPHRSTSILAALCLWGLTSVSAHAAVQRSFYNGSFEIPALASNTACWTQVPDSTIPGWTTSHTSQAPSGGSCPAPLAPATGKLIELWANGQAGVFARAGKVLAELNAEQASTLSQTLCINNGEQVTWSLSHRGRTGVDQMQFYVGATPAVGMVLTASTGLAANTSIDACQNGTSITTNTACAASGANVSGTQWGDYSGAFTWNGASGDTAFNFGALASNGGNLTFGNFLDNISVRLTPFIELSSGTADNVLASESAGALSLGIKVSGDFPSAQTVSVSVTGGTATLGSDFTTPNGLATFNVTIPAGSYDGTTSIPLGITVLDDGLLEGSETVQLTVNPNPGAFQIQSTSVCGGAQNANITFTIQDNDSLAAPQASNDAATTNFNTAITLSVWSNDTAPSGSTLSGNTVDLDPATPGVQTTTTVAGQGTFTSNNNGTVTFSPVAGFVGTVSVPYTISDSLNRVSNQATISVTVRNLASSSVPVANNDTASTAPVTPVNISVLNNDVPGTGNTLTVGTVTLANTIAGQGTWSVNAATGVVTFTPAAGFTGTATATYTVSDSGPGVSNSATISVTVPSAASGSVSGVPTLTQWALMLVTALLALTTVPHLRRTASTRRQP
ncbi:MAG TPA: Ig-like domain-containing protein [Burkholderiaceae bacterium]|nr:Ig-like domain-containing protein [Burkholderiaceae bacterium]